MPTPMCLICSAWWFKKKLVLAHTQVSSSPGPRPSRLHHPEHHHLCLFPGPYRHLSVHPNN